MPILDIVALIPLAYLAVVAIPLITTDVREHRLPNKFVLPFIAISFLTSIAVAIISGDWVRLLITIGVAFAILFIGIYLNARDVVGMGDVKLFVAVALSLTTFSIWFVLATMLVSVAVGFVVTIVAITRHHKIASVQLGTYIISVTLLFGAVAVLL